MAVRGFVAADEDVITIAAPAYFGPGHTIAAVVKRDVTTGYHGFFSIGSSLPNPHITFEFTNDGRLEYVWQQLRDRHSYAANSSTEWQLVVVSMPPTVGDVRPRISVFDGSDWSHTDGDVTFPNGSAPEDWTGLDPELRFGNWDAAFNFLDGQIARIALWRTDPLDDSEVEALAGGTKADWATAGADHLWEFDQSSTATEVQDYIGSCDQTAISGTSVVFGDDPPDSIITMAAPAVAEVTPLGEGGSPADDEDTSVSFTTEVDAPAGADVLMTVAYYMFPSSGAVSSITGATWEDGIHVDGVGHYGGDSLHRIAVVRARLADDLPSGSTLTVNFSGGVYARSVVAGFTEDLADDPFLATLYNDVGGIDNPWTTGEHAIAEDGVLLFGGAWIAFRNTTSTPLDGAIEVGDLYVSVQNNTHANAYRQVDVGDWSLSGDWATAGVRWAAVGAAYRVVGGDATPDTTPPVATVTTPPSETTIDQATTTTFEFRANEAIQAWKVKVVPTYAAEHDEGAVIGTSNGSLHVTGGALDADTDQSVTIHGADLDAASPGAGSKVVKVFAQDLAGNWSAL